METYKSGVEKNHWMEPSFLHLYLRTVEVIQAKSIQRQKLQAANQNVPQISEFHHLLSVQRYGLTQTLSDSKTWSFNTYESDEESLT